MAMQATRARSEPATDGERSGFSTVPEDPPFRKVRRAQWGRRVLVAVLLAILVAGLVGLFGIRTRTAEASAGGYQLEVHFASIARPGVTVPLDLQIHHDGGFSGPITIAVPASYLSAVDAQSPQPEPTSSTSDGDVVVFQFDAPQGDTFGASWEAEVDPAANMGRREATIAVIDNGNPVVSVPIRTWVLP